MQLASSASSASEGDSSRLQSIPLCCTAVLFVDDGLESTRCNTHHRRAAMWESACRNAAIADRNKTTTSRARPEGVNKPELLPSVP